jgi:hypothetical protein
MFKPKILCFALIFIIVTSLYAVGASAGTVCMATCCLQTNSVGMHHTMDEQINPTSNCHSGTPSIPCELQSKKTVYIPECTLTTPCKGFPGTIKTIKISSNLRFDNPDVQTYYLVQNVEEKLHSFSIYLRIQSLII